MVVVDEIKFWKTFCDQEKVSFKKKNGKNQNKPERTRSYQNKSNLISWHSFLHDLAVITKIWRNIGHS
jgi:hypothetical protein